MTVIAWDGVMLAADKRAVNCGLGTGTVTKIHRFDGGLCAFSGDLDIGMQMVAWVQDGAKPEAFPAHQAEDCAASFMVIRPGGVILAFERTPIPLRFEERQRAMGSGRDYALAAMHLGCDARRAVEVACHFDTGCGNGIDTLTLD